MALEEQPPRAAAERAGGLAMLRRMKFTMLLADAARVAYGNVDILGGGCNITRPRAWHDQACAELEARLAQACVPWEGIASKR